MKLRDYQTRLVKAGVEFCHKAGAAELDVPSGVIVAPTGAGKTVIATNIAKPIVDAGERVLMLVHRKELAEQSVRAFARAFPGWATKIGVVQSAMGMKQYGAQIQIAGIQSVFRKPELLGRFALTMADECHLVSPNDKTTWPRVLNMLSDVNPYMATIGLSATPWRMGSGLVFGRNRQFHSMIEQVLVSDLVRDGFLAPMMVEDDVEGAIDTSTIKRGSDGDYRRGDLEECASRSETVLAGVIDLAKRAVDRQKWLIFCSGVGHAKLVSKGLADLGFDCPVVVGKTKNRAEILGKLNSGDVRGVVNCDVLTTGFDEPGIDMVAVMRPTLSRSLFAQMVGRGRRLAAGKDDCLVLDYGGNVARHGSVDRLDDLAELVDEEKKEKPGKRTCLYVEVVGPDGKKAYEDGCKGVNPPLDVMNSRSISATMWKKGYGDKDLAKERQELVLTLPKDASDEEVSRFHRTCLFCKRVMAYPRKCRDGKAFVEKDGGYDIVDVKGCEQMNKVGAKECVACGSMFAEWQDPDDMHDLLRRVERLQFSIQASSAGKDVYMPFISDIRPKVITKHDGTDIVLFAISGKDADGNPASVNQFLALDNPKATRFNKAWWTGVFLNAIEYPDACRDVRPHIYFIRQVLRSICGSVSRDSSGFYKLQRTCSTDEVFKAVAECHFHSMNCSLDDPVSGLLTSSADGAVFRDGRHITSSGHFAGKPDTASGYPVKMAINGISQTEKRERVANHV